MSKEEIEGAVTDVLKALETLGTSRLKEMDEKEFSERFCFLADAWEQAVKKIQNPTKKDGRFCTRLEKVEKGFAKLVKLDFSTLENEEVEKVLGFLLKKINSVEDKIKQQFKKKEKKVKEQDKFQF